MNGLYARLCPAGCRCVVVGGGRQALRRAVQLADAGARVTALAPCFCAGWPAAVQRVRGSYAPAFLQGAALAVAATDDAALNARIAADARAAGALCLCATRCAEATVHPLAARHAGGIAVAVETGVPALSARLAARLAAVAAGYGPCARLLAAIRPAVLAKQGRQQGAKTLRRLAALDPQQLEQQAAAWKKEEMQ